MNLEPPASKTPAATVSYDSLDRTEITRFLDSSSKEPRLLVFLLRTPMLSVIVLGFRTGVTAHRVALAALSWTDSPSQHNVAVKALREDSNLALIILCLNESRCLTSVRGQHRWTVSEIRSTANTFEQIEPRLVSIKICQKLLISLISFSLLLHFFVYLIEVKAVDLGVFTFSCRLTFRVEIHETLSPWPCYLMCLLL